MQTSFRTLESSIFSTRPSTALCLEGEKYRLSLSTGTDAKANTGMSFLKTKYAQHEATKTMLANITFSIRH